MQFQFTRLCKPRPYGEYRKARDEIFQSTRLHKPRRLCADNLRGKCVISIHEVT